MSRTLTLAAAAALMLAATAVAKPAPGDWTTAQKVAGVNTDVTDGCPILSPDGRQLFMASNRTGGHGGLDIWVATRESEDEPFGAPVNLPAPVNSGQNDFCPTPLRGGRLLFVSNRPGEGACGMGDIYVTRLNPEHGWREPRRLRCSPDGPNTELDEQGPSVVETDGGEQLYFSSSAPTVPGELYVSSRPEGGQFGPGAVIAELQSPGNDIQPNVRKDGREMVFSSDHGYPGAKGRQDIYVSTRESTGDPWSAPVNLGPAINTGESESRPSLSWDARTLLFGRAPGAPITNDIHISTR